MEDEWQERMVETVRGLYREHGKAPNMAVLLLKTGETEKISLVAPDPNSQRSLLQSVREVVAQRKEEVAEVMLMFNAYNEKSDNLLALIFETPRKLTLRRFVVHGKTLKEQVHKDKVGMSVGLYSDVDYGSMYG